MSPAENMPDFDKMSPEEMMAWMESLAKRQGATEGFTTAADLTIAEVDPDSVVIDEPGYVPSEGKSKGQAPTAEPKRSAPLPAAPPPPPPPPVVQAPPPPVAAVPPPVLEPVSMDEDDLVETEITQPLEDQGAMAWLESLAADTGGLPELDLSALGAEIEPISFEPAGADNPIAWLENLAESQGVPTAPAEPPAVPAAASAAPIGDAGDPFASGVDPMTWLESLAKRQGVKDEELLTQANLEVPMPESAVDDGPGYTDYSVDAPANPEAATTAEPAIAQAASSLDPSELESPADWLDSLASGQGFGLKPATQEQEEEPHLSDDAMKKALATGQEIDPNQMEAWFNRQLDRGFEREEPELPDEDEELALNLDDPDAPAVPAALPDWLSEMAPAAPPPMPVIEQQAFVEQIVEPPAVPDMPDWLQEEVSAHSDLDLDIFAPDAAAPAAPVSVGTQDIEKDVDRSDPWVEAFDHEQGIISLSDMPPSTTAPAALESAKLEPEEELPVGQPEVVPDWLDETAVPVLEAAEMPDWLGGPEEAAEPLSADDMPDWLKEVGSEIELAEVPDWLKETSDTEEQIVIPTPTPAATTTTPVTVPSISPAPIPVAASISDADAAVVLGSARSQAEENVDGSLLEYERLVRANAQLDAVVGDLGSLVKKNEKNPAVYRVLGDALMRQGQLQAALDTYRNALNLL